MSCCRPAPGHAACERSTSSGPAWSSAATRRSPHTPRQEFTDRAASCLASVRSLGREARKPEHEHQRTNSLSNRTVLRPDTGYRMAVIGRAPHRAPRLTVPEGVADLHGHPRQWCRPNDCSPRPRTGGTDPNRPLGLPQSRPPLHAGALRFASTRAARRGNRQPAEAV